MNIKRITINADQMAGVPCIRGLRIPAATVVGMVAAGMTDAEILAAYPDLESDDIREALAFAAEAVGKYELKREAALRCEPYVSEEELQRRAQAEGHSTEQVIAHLESL